MKRLELYCKICQDYVYSEPFDAALLAASQQLMQQQGQHKPVHQQPKQRSSMVFFHAPLLRSFYLGEGHTPSSCRLSIRDKPCLSCQMEAVFAEVYSGNRQPFSPAEFLYQWWRFADSLAGYQQQDAHEFYLSLHAADQLGALGTLAALGVTHQLELKGSSGGSSSGGAWLCPAGPQQGLLLPGSGLQHQLMQQHLQYAGSAGFEVSWQRQRRGLTPGAAAEGSGCDTPMSSGTTPEPECHQTAPPHGPDKAAAAASLVELVFSGLLRSDVTCCACGHTSTAHDPFRDISLDLMSDHVMTEYWDNNDDAAADTAADTGAAGGSQATGLSKPQYSADAQAATPGFSMEGRSGVRGAAARMNDLTLAGCLRRFVRPERLGSGAHWRCSSCGSTAAALKQMSIRRLPLVLCFHVKRFEHGGATQRPRKLDAPLRFPLQGLDMAPFTTSQVLRSQLLQRGACSNAAACGAGTAAEEAAEVAWGSSYQQQCLYELFGVVSHWGDMQSGHYVSYIKCDGFWYLINDPWVVAVTEADVAQVQAYMLFYTQQHVFGNVSSSNCPAGSSQVGPSSDQAQ
eukprot:gene4801-5050_t